MYKQSALVLTSLYLIYYYEAIRFCSTNKIYADLHPTIYQIVREDRWQKLMLVRFIQIKFINWYVASWMLVLPYGQQLAIQ